MEHHPVYDVSTGSWHAAYRTPGEDGWTSVHDCGTKRAAIETCNRLNAQAQREKAEHKLDQRLRGFRA